MNISRQTGNKAKTQRGYTLLEILVAMVIGLFLLGGLLAIEQSNKTAFIGQDQLGKLRDSQRMALTMMNDVIQMAGYFPDPVNNVAAGVLAADGPNNLAAGQAITGAGNTITVRYRTASGDGVLNCSGSSNGSGADATYVNVFKIVGNQLVCSMNNTDYPLVGGGSGINQISLQNMTILYGVKTNTATDNFNVDTYLTAAQVTDWNSVMSVVVILTFNNPLYVAGQNQGQPQTLSIQRVINIMNKTGVKV